MTKDCDHVFNTKTFPGAAGRLGHCSVHCKGWCILADSLAGHSGCWLALVQQAVMSLIEGCSLASKCHVLEVA